MPGPSPDGGRGRARGVAELPPAAVSEEHVRRALEAVYPTVARVIAPADVDELSWAARTQIRRAAQAIADAERRGRVEAAAELRAAGAVELPVELVRAVLALARGYFYRGGVCLDRRALDEVEALLPPEEGRGTPRRSG